MAWKDNFNTIYEQKFDIADYKYWLFQLEEHKSKGTLHMNIRMFQKAKEEGQYEGPTKNGIMLQINSVEEINNFQNELNKFFDSIKDKF